MLNESLFRVIKIVVFVFFENSEYFKGIIYLNSPVSLPILCESMYDSTQIYRKPNYIEIILFYSGVCVLFIRLIEQSNFLYMKFWSGHV